VVSVVVPAYNEAEALKSCLPALGSQDFRGPAELIVVANGCTDATVAVASELARELPPNWTWRVLELSRAEKAAALNAADAGHDADVTIYLDADIVLGPETVSQLVAFLSGSGPRLASRGSSSATRAAPGER
jgi:glycosyltransferase involved in cell wall biosynthesis